MVEDFKFIDAGTINLDKKEETITPLNNSTIARDSVVNIMSEKTSHGLEETSYSHLTRQFDKAEEGKNLKGEGVYRPYKPLPVEEVIKKTKETKDFTLAKQDRFWKHFGIAVLILGFIVCIIFIRSVKDGNFKSELQPLTEINNSYSFAPAINTPVNSQVSNQYNNTYSFNFDLSKEFINKFCNNS